ncbi:uncharacterized protein LOC118438664 [Folsomia candida]|uniref:uncharacterized protein LOC118438664 n=1 Tax=Folsomia candida TaxID=158441 RepID=UPI001604E08E|nr:uncharacterized protein LOC118438664 [Folsomia candida]
MEPFNKSTNFASSSKNWGLAPQIFYQCNVCKVIFERREQCVTHKEDKHGSRIVGKNGELSTCKSSNSFKKCETGMDYKFDMNTTPDVVKLHGLKRAATIKKMQCHFCRMEVINWYNERVVGLDGDRQNSGHCCEKCLNSQYF